MPRTERELMTWEFGLESVLSDGTRDCIFKKITIPHDWAIFAPFDKDMEQGLSQGFRNRYGVGWYKRNLSINEKKQDHRYFLDFGGIFEKSTIYVNGKEAGGHCYGYSSFRIDITEFLRTGDNEIRIKVDNTSVPSDRWYSGAGIYRTVKLIETENVYLDEREIVVQTGISGANAVVRINAGVNRRICARLSNADTVIESAGDSGILEINVENAKLWSAEEPNLYKLELNLTDGERIADSVMMSVGIREVSFIPDKGLFVNGTRVILKGVCLHQDTGCRGIASRKEIWRERLCELKKMGCNTIRPSHHTFSPEFLDLCDEMGFYVYEEPFDKWRSGLYARYFKEHWQEDIDCMVKRDRNRPSIIIWGTGNEVENQGQQSMLDILSMIRNYIRTLDSTRPVSYAMNPHFKRESNRDASKVKDIQQFVDVADDYEIYDNDERIRRIKAIADIVDIISCNYQEQWYEVIHRACPDKLILGTEVFQFFRGHYDQMQNFTIDNPAFAPVHNDYVVGSIIWTGYDYLGESVVYPAKGWGGALIRTNGEKRFSFYILQSYWTKEPMVHFSVMDYSLSDEGVKEHWDLPIYADHWHFPQFRKVLIPYAIASNCDEVALYLNGKRFYIPKPAEYPNRLITGFLPYQPGSVRVVGYREGIEVCSHETTTPEHAVQLVFDRSEININADKNYEMLLTVRAKDEKGINCLKESGLVRFRIEGNAEILAVDNGNIMGGEVYHEDFMHMYHGCVSILIRFNGKPGRIKLCAYSDGLRAGEAVIINSK